MKNKLIAVCLPITLLLVFTGCKPQKEDPRSVAMAFIDAMKSDEFNNAKKYVTSESKSSLETMENLVNMAKKHGDGQDDINLLPRETKDGKLEYGEAKIKGERATVALTVGGKVVLQIPLKKEEGAWKVIFDMAELMNPATEMNEIPVPKDKTLQEMHDVEDSVKSKLEEARKATEEVPRK